MAQRSAKIVSDEAMGGEPRIDGRRITVLQVRDLVEESGLEPATVADRYDLDVAAVYRALTYFHEHPSEMAQVREDREDTIEQHRERGLTPNDVE